jgi:hypothetical protein
MTAAAPRAVRRLEASVEPARVLEKNGYHLDAGLTRFT